MVSRRGVSSPSLFFDEAHLLFSGMPKPLLDKIETVFRLIRSKGVGDTSRTHFGIKNANTHLADQLQFGDQNQGKVT